MSTLKHFLTILAVAFALIFPTHAAEPPQARMDEKTTDEGSLDITPDSGVAATYGTWTVQFTVGSGGIAEGSGIRVQMPDAWHAGPRNSAYPLQASRPEADHYVTAQTSRSDAQVTAIVEHERDTELIKHAKPSLDGRVERYVFVVRVHVAEGTLQEGDTISVVYGDKSGGSRGYRVGTVAVKKHPVLAAVDATGDGQFQLLEDTAAVTIAPGPPASLQVHAPSTAVAGNTFPVLISILDKEANLVDTETTLQLRLASGNAAFPETVTIPKGQGHARFDVTNAEAGILRVAAESADKALMAQSNPVRVTAEAPERRILWGELHSHSQHSWDGVGDQPFDYARNAAGLDFYALTDHSLAPTNQGAKGLNEDSWPAYTAEVEAHHDPPAFVTIHAYECSFGTPWGHHNVFFRGAPGHLAYPGQTSLPELWKMLQAGKALTIPHHTGKFPKGVDFTEHDPELRRNFEIYSGHGLSEAYNPDHPLAFEQSLFTSDARSLDHPSFAQDAWAIPRHMSTIAASDDHRAQPGKPYYGLTAVYATENSRDAVFQALYDRRTYGTTGAKIILDFTMNGEPMGSVLGKQEEAKFELEAIGTDDIEWVELLRHQPGDESFQAIKQWTPGAPEFNATYNDEDYQPGSIYYMRLKQSQPVGPRTAMAWSSPIWTAEE